MGLFFLFPAEDVPAVESIYPSPFRSSAPQINPIMHILPIVLSLAGSTIANDAIVGGSIAKEGQFPYQVSVRTSSFICGGTIVDKDHILTAAHCVANVTQHPEWNADTLKNDIAILKLASSLDFGSTIAAVELPASSDAMPETGTQCSVSGWGATSAGGSTPSNLEVAYIDIIDHAQCVEEYKSDNEVDDSMICAGAEAGGKDACQGDSGGPLVDVSTKKQIGVVSWGLGCGRHNQHGVYVSTAAYLDWIKETVSS
ncbi:unnamed protein product [Penicillium olsonii]|uniref:Peptidase S1 domain-containing protein n=1 Tax=Penicillium olsonii TaxID=99116 RepID=A0A9W4MV45_PENOL|nr:unnamed protein product [Penicillium olsonii]